MVAVWVRCDPASEQLIEHVSLALDTMAFEYGSSTVYDSIACKGQRLHTEQLRERLCIKQHFRSGGWDSQWESILTYCERGHAPT